MSDPEKSDLAGGISPQAHAAAFSLHCRCISERGHADDCPNHPAFTAVAGQGAICDHHYDPVAGCDGVYDETGRCDQCGRPPLEKPTGWPDKCHNCGAHWSMIGFDYALGFNCRKCGGCDADE